LQRCVKFDWPGIQPTDFQHTRDAR